MSRIGFNPSVGTGVKKVARNRNQRIESLRNEIAQVRYQEQIGVITKEEADAKVSLLQAKIDELEFGVPEGSDVEIVEPPKFETILPDAFNPEGNSDFSENSDPNNDNNGNTFGKNDIYSAQANYNRAIHGI